MRVSVTCAVSRPMLKWTIRERVLTARIAVDHGNSAVISGTNGTSSGVRTHKKPVEKGFSPKTPAALFVVHNISTS